MDKWMDGVVVVCVIQTRGRRSPQYLPFFKPTTTSGLEPEFVAFHCFFRDDVHVGVGGSIYQPIDAQDLCSPSLTPEAADRMLREAACSLQR